jgi:para-nitrobenzyl esterase
MNKNLGRGCAVLLFSLLGGGATVIASAATPSATVTIDSGKLRGDVDGDVGSFKGIPFALPPVGELRWRPPQAAAEWQGVREATTYGADCMQIQPAT